VFVARELRVSSVRAPAVRPVGRPGGVGHVRRPRRSPPTWAPAVHPVGRPGGVGHVRRPRRSPPTWQRARQLRPSSRQSCGCRARGPPPSARGRPGSLGSTSAPWASGSGSTPARCGRAVRVSRSPGLTRARWPSCARLANMSPGPHPRRAARGRRTCRQARRPCGGAARVSRSTGPTRARPSCARPANMSCLPR